MPECHKCPHANGNTEEKQRFCPSCGGDTKLFANETSLEALKEASYEPRETLTPQEIIARAEGDAEDDDFLPREKMEMLADFFFRFMMLEPREMYVIAARFQGVYGDRREFTLTDIATHLRTSKQEVKFIMNNAIAKCPVLRAMFPRMSFTPTKQQIERSAALPMIQGELNFEEPDER